jgi:hypothetical protein
LGPAFKDLSGARALAGEPALQLFIFEQSPVADLDYFELAGLDGLAELGFADADPLASLRDRMSQGLDFIYDIGSPLIWRARQSSLRLAVATVNA